MTKQTARQSFVAWLAANTPGGMRLSQIEAQTDFLLGEGMEAYIAAAREDPATFERMMGELGAKRIEGIYEAGPPNARMHIPGWYWVFPCLTAEEPAEPADKPVTRTPGEPAPQTAGKPEAE